jgi:hypothetical protein
MSDDEHERILNTPIIEGQVLDEAIARLGQAEQGDDSAAAGEALTELGALVRTMLENTADLYRMDHSRICLAALVAGFEMAKDGSFELQSAVAQYAREQLKLLASKH